MLSAADGATDDQFGRAVALSGDTALMGAPYRNTDGQVRQRRGLRLRADPAPALTVLLADFGPRGHACDAHRQRLRRCDGRRLQGTPTAGFNRGLADADHGHRAARALPAARSPSPRPAASPPAPARLHRPPRRPSLPRSSPAAGKRGAAGERDRQVGSARRRGPAW